MLDARSPLFYRLDTEQRVIPGGLEDAYGGPQRSACWLIGGGPSLNDLPCAEIAASPLPKLTVNLAGSGKLRPSFWTSYDPTVRFHRSIYLDPGVMKFVHRRRAMDLVPETAFKVCECPNTWFFDRDAGRGFSNFLAPLAPGLIDWADSLVQAIDLLYRLGFRSLYLAGCELRIDPSAAQRERARAAGMPDECWHTLADFVRKGTEFGITQAELEELAPPPAYHFAEEKSLTATIQTDAHYFRIAQCLRLSRRCLTQHGLELISVTPGSRLNDYFPYRPIEDVLQQIRATVGDPTAETTHGLYTQQTPRWKQALQPMRDVKPPNWSPSTALPVPAVVPATPELLVDGEGWVPAGQRFQQAYVAPPEVG